MELAKQIVRIAEERYGNARYDNIDTIVASAAEWEILIAEQLRSGVQPKSEEEMAAFSIADITKLVLSKSDEIGVLEHLVYLAKMEMIRFVKLARIEGVDHGEKRK